MTTVFYSWQSDLPNKTNRGLIGDALIKATKAIRDDDTIEVEPVVDRDTAGVAGSPDIGATIFAKIEHAAAFVCDVSIINARTDGTRPTPNPNVLIELGYAAKTLGWPRILLVLNEAYGPVEQLPFDLRLKRAVVYRSDPEDEERAPARAKLARDLEVGLRAILSEAPTVATTPHVDAVEGVTTGATDMVALIGDYMTWLVNELRGLNPKMGGPRPDDDELVDAIEHSIPLAVGFAQLANAVARHAAHDAATAIVRGFEPILQEYTFPPRQGGSYRQTDFDFYKFIGHELFVILISALMRVERFEIIQAVLSVDLCIDTRYGRQNRPWTDLSAYCALLDEARSQRLKLSRVSIRADLLKERHTSGDLGSAAPFESFVEADYFLFLAAELHPEESPLLTGADVWRPWSNVFMEWTQPSFLVRAERLSYAQKLLVPLKIPDIDMLRARYTERGGLVAQLFQGRMGIFRLGKVDPKTIGSRK